MKQFFYLLIPLLMLFISPNTSFAATNDSATFEELEMKKYAEDYAKLLCMYLSAYEHSIESCDKFPSKAQAEYVGLSDAKVLEKFFLIVYESDKELGEEQFLDPSYYLNSQLSEEELAQKYKNFFTNLNKVVHNISTGISELEYREYVFKPVVFFDDNCNTIIDFIITEPEFQLPKSTASEFEIYKWVTEYDEKLNQRIILLSWQYGDNFVHVALEDDKLILEKFQASLEQLNKSVQKLQEKRSAENIHGVRDALNDIESIPAKYENEVTLSIVDFDEESSELIIETSIAPENFYENEAQNKNCSKSASSYSEFGNDIQQLQIEESQMRHSLQFVEYKIDTFPSPKVQLEYGVSPQNVNCNEGQGLLLRPNMQSSICVKHNSSEKFVQRGWIMPNLI